MQAKLSMQASVYARSLEKSFSQNKEVSFESVEKQMKKKVQAMDKFINDSTKRQNKARSRYNDNEIRSPDVGTNENSYDDHQRNHGSNILGGTTHNTLDSLGEKSVQEDSYASKANTSTRQNIYLSLKSKKALQNSVQTSLTSANAADSSKDPTKENTSKKSQKRNMANKISRSVMSSLDTGLQDL
jgi:hypothetical protein